jgi:hypothetical protein
MDRGIRRESRRIVMKDKPNNRPRRLLVNFSGGRTSGYMTRRILEAWKDDYDDIIVIFANTGQEHEKTLEFVNNCDVHFGFNTIWLETVVSPEMGVGGSYKVVDFETASRDGRPYEDGIAKYGIPHGGGPWCTRELKVVPARKYCRDIGWASKTYDQILGIRADEMDRMSPDAKDRRVLYPLVRLGVTKQHILDWWSEQPFDLEIEEHQGNCLWCFKKSLRKLLTLAMQNPEWFEFPDRMEREYGLTGSMARRHGAQTFFREGRSTRDIIASSAEPFVPWSPTTAAQQIGLFSLDEMDYSNGCSESCEVDYV